MKFARQGVICICSHVEFYSKLLTFSVAVVLFHANVFVFPLRKERRIHCHLFVKNLSSC